MLCVFFFRDVFIMIESSFSFFVWFLVVFVVMLLFFMMMFFICWNLDYGVEYLVFGFFSDGIFVNLMDFLNRNLLMEVGICFCILSFLKILIYIWGDEMLKMVGVLVIMFILLLIMLERINEII